MKVLINGIIYWLNFSLMGFHLLFQSTISILWEFYVWKNISNKYLVLSMAWQPTMRSKEQKDLSNMTKQLKKYQDNEPITERMTATAEKAREVKQWKSQSKTEGKTKASVASRLSRAVAGREFGNQKNTCYILTRSGLCPQLKEYTSIESRWNAILPTLRRKRC